METRLSRRLLGLVPTHDTYTCRVLNCRDCENCQGQEPRSLQICKKWQEGRCFGLGCHLRHYYEDEDSPLKLSKRFDDDVNCSSSRSTNNFSSPYQLKILKEVKTQRIEEVDLDTGRRKSWIQTSDVEVYDLTGDTPVKSSRNALQEISNFEELGQSLRMFSNKVKDVQSKFSEFDFRHAGLETRFESQRSSPRSTSCRDSPTSSADESVMILDEYSPRHSYRDDIAPTLAKTNSPLRSASGARNQVLPRPRRPSLRM